ncbi:MAG: ROK family protein [Candidatus Doudnabacteria bacterium]
MFIVFDIGATSTRIAKSQNGKSLDVVQKYPTPRDYQEALNKLKETITALADNKSISKISGGQTGQINSQAKTSHHNGALKLWSGYNLTQDLKNIFGCPVHIINDAAAAALGEAYFGAGKTYESFFYYTISTGIGGAWIKHKKIIAGIQHNSEPGHQILDVEKWSSMEDLISGTALHGEQEFISTPQSNQTDWINMKEKLIAGLFNTACHWPSQAIILGGGVTLSGAIPIDELEQELQSKLNIIQQSPVIKKAELGDNAGLWGALSLLH